MHKISNISNMDRVIKQRSAAACMKEGFSFLGKHIRNIIYSTWMYIVAVAIFMTIYFITFEKTITTPITAENALGILITLYLAYLLYNVCILFFTGRLFHLFREFRDTQKVQRLKPFQQFKTTCGMGLRSLVFYIWVMILSAPGLQLFSTLWSWIPQPHSQFGFGALAIAAMAIAIVAFISLIPLVHTFYKYVLDGGSFLKMIGKSYGRAARHKGLIIATNMLTIILLSIIMGIVMLPFIIITLASTQSAIGVLLGDEAGVPSHFNALLYITYFVTFVVIITCTIMAYATLLYLYGSIEAQEDEREKYINQTETKES